MQPSELSARGGARTHQFSAANRDEFPDAIFFSGRQPRWKKRLATSGRRKDIRITGEVDSPGVEAWIHFTNRSRVNQLYFGDLDHFAVQTLDVGNYIRLMQNCY